MAVIYCRSFQPSRRVNRDSLSVSPPSRRVNRPPFSLSSIELPVHVQEEGSVSQGDSASNCEQSFSPPLDLVGQFTVMGADSAVAFDAGATGNLVCRQRLERSNSSVKRWRVPRAGAARARARFEFGDGRIGEVNYAGNRSRNAPAGIVCNRGKSAGIVCNRGNRGRFPVSLC